ncbi:DM13 domain-containing protein [Mucilaginibacter gossypii]|uniref:DM13 domain-containing protein n=1 Tax=Mucilaginibacter gossypii TaxID=551996 RepID=UPI000DCE639F|nr:MULTISPECIES: DM13 domain-containing protein [Mucilaginibacter]QTE39806.1 DM13 domain-containing protein [Mucilaginibacter gossypii]RAV54184.1 hypothetical protein DIU36_21420 [Mucilaginibacter rubeus]
MKTPNFLKISIIVLLTCTILAGCKKGSTPTATLNERIDASQSKPASNSGDFSNGPYGTVTGTARVFLTGGKYQLALEGFSTSNGPDLKVYISQEQNPVHFVNLGSLKSTSGNQVYDIPSEANVKDYAYALIYCQQYHHLFGYTQLTF